MFIPLVCSHVDLKVYRLLFLIYLSLFLIKKSFPLFLLFAHYLRKQLITIIFGFCSLHTYNVDLHVSLISVFSVDELTDPEA